MASHSRGRSSRRPTMVSWGARLLSLLSLLLLGSLLVTPASSSPTAVPPANHESILHALRFQGMTTTADSLDNVIWNRGFMVPPSATLFVPMNAAMAPVAASLNVTELIGFLSKHIVTENLPVRRLRELPVGTELQTMVRGSPLVVTENTETGMTINHQKVRPKDLCTISTVACYAVKEVLLLPQQESGADGDMMSLDVPAGAPVGEAPIQPPTGLPPPPSGAPVVTPLTPVPPPAGSPLVAPVPTGAPATVLPPSAESPETVPVPANAPAVPVSPTPPAGSPGGAPLSPAAEAPGPEGAAGDSSAAVATTASMATLLAALTAVTRIIWG